MRPPNIVMIISDQQRADTMPGERVAKGIHTPHIEWLAEQGTLFRHAYATVPMCSPARASILSGLYPHAHGMVANNQPRPISEEMVLSQHVKLLADYLKPEGYICGYSGKWHLGTAGDRRGFRDFVSRSAAHEVDEPDQNEVLKIAERLNVPAGSKASGRDPDPERFDRRTGVGSTILPLALHASMHHAQKAAEFIRRMASESSPFCLVYSCREPHPPFISPQPFDRMYHPYDMPLPDTLRDSSSKEVMRNRVDWQLQPTDSYRDEDLQAMWAGYYGAVSYVDHLTGTLLEALIDTDQFDDTLLIFTSDHGEMLGSHGMIKKGAVLYEELVRIPLLIHPPGGTGTPQKTNRLVSHVDLVPTVLDYCGLPSPEICHGRSIRPLVERDNRPIRDAVALEYYTSNWGEKPFPLRGWRTERWKYVETQQGPAELYDLSQDPSETQNLVSNESSHETRLELQRHLRQWMDETDDAWPTVPLPNREVDRTYRDWNS